MNACIEAQGHRLPKGYATSYICVPKQYTVLQHRWAFERAWGIKIPPGMFVMHTCDNPPCVNPLHLRLGTVFDNNRDRDRKGRGANQFSGRTHCSRGHEYVPGSHWVSPRGARKCYECHNLRQRAARVGSTR